jgi:hypothetical protein
MAVKVMIAPAIARRHDEKRAGPGAGTTGPKPKRRRSSVYDADGNEVFITLICLKCQKVRPLAQFGLRKMADGAIRNQPWCRACRSASTEKPRRAESPPPSPATEPVASATQEPRRPGSVAAEVAAALAAGMRR